MFDFFSKILGYVESFFEYFVDFLESLMTALGILISSIAVPLSLSSMLPTILSSAVIIVVALAVAKFIIGR